MRRRWRLAPRRSICPCRSQLHSGLLAAWQALAGNALLGPGQRLVQQLRRDPHLRRLLWLPVSSSGPQRPAAGVHIGGQGDETVICGLIADQPALHGLLTEIRDLGLCLISVRRLATGQAETRHHHQT